MSWRCLFQIAIRVNRKDANYIKCHIISFVLWLGCVCLACLLLVSPPKAFLNERITWKKEWKKLKHHVQHHYMCNYYCITHAPSLPICKLLTKAWDEGMSKMCFNTLDRMATSSRVCLPVSNHSTWPAVISCMNLLSGIERNQPWPVLHMYIFAPENCYYFLNVL